MYGSRSAWKRAALLVGGLCVGGALTLRGAGLHATEFVPLPPIETAEDKEKKDKEKNDKKKNDKNDKNDKKDENGKKDDANGTAARGLPAHLAHVPILDLPGCKQIALSKQPAIAAAHAGYQSALARQSALDTIRVPNFLARDLPVRKTQASVGVNVAHHEIQRVQIDTLYAVTFSYLSAQYAAEQRTLLDSSRERLLKLQEGVTAGLKAGKTNIRKEDEPRVEMTLQVLESRREEAIQGEQRAMSALREALGVDPYQPLILRATGQFRLTPDLSKDQLVALALERRPEIHQVTLLNQVHDLEIEAQGKRSLFPTKPTFASGSDIHARPLPAGSYNENYSPAALGPDMPVTINGHNKARAEVARTYYDRSGNVVEKTRNLIVLETEQAYFRYLEACNKLPRLIESVKKAQAVFDATDAAYTKGERATTPRDWIAAGSQVTELKSQVNQARYQLLVALAGLERATAGGFCPSFELAPTTDPTEPDENKKIDKDKEKNNDEKLEQLKTKPKVELND